MRAVQITRFGGPEVMDVVDLPDPTPGPGQQLYEVSSAGVTLQTPTRRKPLQSPPHESTTKQAAAGVPRSDRRASAKGWRSR
ncbi:hypothetical protein GB931_02825 [Modestobacter sp. I12A-02628]|nr:hypothetical protein [Goekera deserti]